MNDVLGIALILLVLYGMDRFSKWCELAKQGRLDGYIVVERATGRLVRGFAIVATLEEADVFDTIEEADSRLHDVDDPENSKFEVMPVLGKVV